MKKIIKKLLLKGIALVLMFSVLGIATTSAFLSDTEISNGNNFSAGSLDFSLTSPGGFAPLPLTPGVLASRSALVNNDGSSEFNYDIRSVETGGNHDFCNALNLEAKLGGVTKYNSTLLGFVLSPAVLFGGSDSWEFNVWFDSTDTSLQNQTCDFNLVFRSWQTDSDGTWGFLDEEILVNNLQAGDWTCPYAKIDSPVDGTTLSGTIEIKGTVTDNAPHHYWLVVQNSAGVTVAGPGVVNETNSFTNNSLLGWNTTAFPDGDYTIKLEARDSYDNKCPDLAPVPADLEIPDDSVDWITVTIDNTAPPTPLLISPGNNIKIKASNLYLDWSDVADPHDPVKYEYRLYLENPDTDPSASIRYQKDYYEPISRHPETGFASGTPKDEYWWRVRACDQLKNCSNWTPAWHFLVDNSLTDPTSDGTASSASVIVLNEILPDPLGADDGDKPDGEWIELYNKSDSTISVAGWHLTDTTDIHLVSITGDKTNTGGTDIPGHEFLVVYVGPTPLNLDDGGDTISLYNNTNSLIDSHTYTGPVPEGKSIARIPDGGSTWYDPIPTPGEPNKLEETIAWSDLPSFEQPKAIPELDFYLEEQKTAVGFRVSNISQYESLDYQIIYQTEGIEKGIGGNIVLKGENEILRNDLILGTCSQQVCVYDKGITEIKLNVKLTNKDEKEISLNKSIKL